MNRTGKYRIRWKDGSPQPQTPQDLSLTAPCQVMDSRDFGLPQRRLRLWVVGYKKDAARGLAVLKPNGLMMAALSSAGSFKFPIGKFRNKKKKLASLLLKPRPQM